MLLLAQADAPPQPVLTGYEAVVQANGFAITITGLLIVFAALATISLFIAALPKLLHALGPYLPEIHSHHDQPAPSSSASSAAMGGAADPRLVAAIGFAMHASRRSKQ